MASRLAETQVPINDVIARRWSGRAFDPLKPVTREQLTALLEAARWAAVLLQRSTVALSGLGPQHRRQQLAEGLWLSR